MQIIGLDLSLTSTGFAWSSNGATQAETLKPPKGLAGLARLDWIQTAIIARMPNIGSVAVIEDFAFAAKTSGVLERAGLAYMIRHKFWRLGVRFWLASPATLKKFATGRGIKVEKAEIVGAVIKHWGVSPRTDDEADAVVLAQIGRALTGTYDGPLYGYQRDALKGVKVGEVR